MNDGLAHRSRCIPASAGASEWPIIGAKTAKEGCSFKPKDTVLPQ